MQNISHSSPTLLELMRRRSAREKRSASIRQASTDLRQKKSLGNRRQRHYLRVGTQMLLKRKQAASTVLVSASTSKKRKCSASASVSASASSLPSAGQDCDEDNAASASSDKMKSYAALTHAEHLDLVRVRCIITMIQMGGKYCEAALPKIAKILKAGTPRQLAYLRWIMHPETKVEHDFRFADATSGDLLLNLQSFADSEIWVFVLVATIRFLAVDHATTCVFWREFASARDPEVWKATATAAVLHTGDPEAADTRPVAYQPWGRSITPLDHRAKQHQVILNLYNILTASVCCLKAKDPKERFQFSMMQVMMDLVNSPHRLQRKCAGDLRKVFYMSGDGCIHPKSMSDLLACEEAMKLNAQFGKITKLLALKATMNDAFFLVEHTSCALRKYYDLCERNRARFFDETPSLSAVVQRYTNPAKELRYQKVLSIIQG